MVYNPILTAIRTDSETCMTNTVRFLRGVLLENTTGLILIPRIRIQRISGQRVLQFKQTKTIIPVVRSRGTVDDERLVGKRIH